MTRPFGALEMSSRCVFFGPDATRDFLAGIPDDRDDLRDALRDAEELALVPVSDQALQHWTLAVDGQVFRAFTSGFGEVAIGDDFDVTRNWWAEAFSPEQILAQIPGWPDDWSQVRAEL